MQNNSIFKFKKHDRIGHVAAEDDFEFLSECFIDTGDMTILKNISDNRQIVIGRTGTGKSALLSKLSQEKSETVINLSPESLALTYVANSTIIKYFENLGVNLDPFFKLLWRHIFTIEVLTKHFNLKDISSKKKLFDKIMEKLPLNKKQTKETKETLAYLKNWGEKFWEETEYRIKEITNSVEKDLRAKTEATIDTQIFNSKGQIDSNINLSEIQKAEIKTNAQNIISKTQVKDLHNIIKLLDTVLDDKQKHYYIVIDQLDENWVEEKLRYKLIMALLLTSRELTKINNVKLIISMRIDLIDRVFKICRDSGFQEEKFKSQYLQLNWTDEELIDLLDKRIDRLVLRRYTKQKVTHKDLLPKKFNKIPITNYITKIAQRPRDIISLFNKCIEVAPNLSKLTADTFKKATGEYSRERLRALGDEWSADYSCLIDFVKIFYNRPPSFKVESISNEELSELCLKIILEKENNRCSLYSLSKNFVEQNSNIFEYKKSFLTIFYKIGLIGLKNLTYEKESWSMNRNISFAEINDNTSTIINPTYYRALGINEK